MKLLILAVVFFLIILIKKLLEKKESKKKEEYEVIDENGDVFITTSKEVFLDYIKDLEKKNSKKTV